jgi:hypothetical protein
MSTVMINAMLARFIKYTESKKLSKTHQLIYLEKRDKDVRLRKSKKEESKESCQPSVDYSRTNRHLNRMS